MVVLSVSGNCKQLTTTGDLKTMLRQCNDMIVQLQLLWHEKPERGTGYKDPMTSGRTNQHKLVFTLVTVRYSSVSEARCLENWFRC